MKGKISFQSQNDFQVWLNAMIVGYDLIDVGNEVEHAPVNYPCVAVFVISGIHIEITYVYDTDFIA